MSTNTKLVRFTGQLKKETKHTEMYELKYGSALLRISEQDVVIDIPYTNNLCLALMEIANMIDFSQYECIKIETV